MSQYIKPITTYTIIYNVDAAHQLGYISLLTISREPKKLRAELF